MGPAGQHFRDELAKIERFAHDTADESGILEVAQYAIGCSREHDRPRQKVGFAPLQLANDVEAVDDRQHEIEQDYVVMPVAQSLERDIAVAGDIDDNILPAKDRAHEHLDRFVIVDDEDFDR